MKVVIALGGNALGNTPETQIKNARITAKYIVEIIKAGYEVVITHGNGPQVGLINLAFTVGNKVNEKVYEMPFPECNAMSEGYIGYHLENAIKNELLENNIDKNVVSIITEVEVSKDDKAFLNPTKPIGSFYTKDEASKMPYPMMEDSGRGYRRVVASPRPINIVQEKEIETLIDNGFIVIACGGGGIPVIKENNKYIGVDAVIDKDFASQVLASSLDADILLILTAVDNVCLNFGKENEKILEKVTKEEMTRYNEEGHFYKGSMKPKVEASLEFLNSEKKRVAIITSIENACLALENKKGTRIIGE